MSKKIIALNGSPRKNGNTSMLINYFTKGAERSGHQVDTFFLQNMDIHACLGCYSGGKNPDSPCVQKDDMDKIYSAFKEADLIVLASPLYFWTINGQLKCALDRLFAIAETSDGVKMPAKECVLLMAAAGDDDDYEETRYYYERLVKHLGWTDRGSILATGVLKIGDIEGSPYLAEAEKLGTTI